MTIRLMKLVNFFSSLTPPPTDTIATSNYNIHPHTPSPNKEGGGERKHRKKGTVMTKLAIKIWLLIECLPLLMMRCIKKDLEKGILID